MEKKSKATVKTISGDANSIPKLSSKSLQLPKRKHSSEASKYGKSGKIGG